MRVVNPYTFVPFAKGVSRKPYDQYYDQSGRPLISGYLDVELTTKTEMIIPDASKASPEGPRGESSKYPFYRIEGKPVIPGSELRGLLRSVYEAATNSCLPFLPDNRSFSLRTPPYGSYKFRGLLECRNGVWKLYNTRVYRKKVGGKAAVQSGNWQGHQNGEDVCFIPGDRYDFTLTDKNDPNGEAGILQFNVPVVAKRNGIPVEYSVAVLQPWQKIYTWPDNTPYTALRESLGSAGSTIPTQDLLNKLNQISRNGGMIPVWYIQIQKDGEPVYFLSGSSIGRIHQHRSWSEVMGEHDTCASVDALCPACALFGTIKDGGRRGKIRVGDAALEGEAKFRYHLLQPLAGARTTAYEFYLNKPEPDANYWNYDYHGVRRRNPETGMNETEYRNSEEAGPRGRKFYWHHELIAPDDRNPSKMNSTMEAVGSGAKFSFRITFDRITNEQLSQLIWTINLGENRADSSFQHKLGHAKPLGYGSVKLVIKEGKIRTLQLLDNGTVQSEMKAIEQLEVHPFREEMEPVKSILAVSNAEKTKGLQVEYPRRGRDIFSWFAKNRVAQGPTVLPKPTDRDITLDADNPPRTDTAQQGSLPNQPKVDPNGLCGQKVEAMIWNIIPEKNRVYLNLPNKARGVLFDNNGEIIKNYRKGDKITVKVLFYDEQYNNYRTRRN